MIQLKFFKNKILFIVNNFKLKKRKEDITVHGSKSLNYELATYAQFRGGL